MSDLLALAIKNLRDTVTIALEHSSEESSLVLFDDEGELTKLLVEAYRAVLPKAEFLRVADTTGEAIRERFKQMPKHGLVVLVQSTNFRLNEFRFRLEIFARDLKTIEHIHLNRMSKEQWGTYIESLAYNPSCFRPLGHALKERLDRSQRVTVECGSHRLVYDAPMEISKLNVGDYREMKNSGGTFPIGEVFTEPQDLSKVNGEFFIYGFAGMDHMVQVHEPFLVKVREGILESPDAPPVFQDILKMIAEQERVLVREFGLGLNPAMDRERIVNDITAYERMTGLHMSLGEKHGVYKKPGLEPGKTRYHVDVFVAADRILIDDEVVFENGKYTVGG